MRGTCSRPVPSTTASPASAAVSTTVPTGEDRRTRVIPVGRVVFVRLAMSVTAATMSTAIPTGIFLSI